MNNVEYWANLTLDCKQESAYVRVYGDRNAVTVIYYPSDLPDQPLAIVLAQNSGDLAPSAGATNTPPMTTPQNCQGQFGGMG
ncbi:MAG: hypothetical protein AAGD25_38685 [Cyanobacteria bacterium P01_F01_bin.150]